MGLWLLLALASGAITMQLALERDKVEVPDVVGREEEAAAQLLKGLGLKPQVVREEYHDRIPKGAVIAQRPSAGTRVRKESMIRLVVSKGSDKVVVPDLAGLDLERAGQVLIEVGLLVGRIAKVHSDEYAEGQIIAQDPSPGSVSRRGSAVQLLLSLGPLKEPIPRLPDFLRQEDERII